MTRISLFVKISAVLLVVMFSWVMTVPASDAVQELRFSCSAQVYEAYGKEAVEAFEKSTGITVDTHVSSSRIAVSRLMMDFSDVAGTTRPLGYKRIDYGYVQVPFCRDYLAVIVNSLCPVNDLSSEDLRKVFSKKIMNWKELGGLDQEIFVVIPSEETGSFNNFDAQIMSHIEFRYDFMAAKSTIVMDAARYMPDTISFISYGAAVNQKGIKILSIDGRKPGEEAYPYGQVFSYITRGEPAGAVKKFVDFAFTEKGREIIKRKGMNPVK